MCPFEDVNVPRIPGKVVAPTGIGQPSDPTFMDDVIKARRQAAAEEIAKRTFNSGGSGQPDSLAVAIVTKAMDNLNKAEERYQRDADKSREVATAAATELRNAQASLSKIQLDQTNATLTKVEAAIDAMKHGQPPKSTADTIREAQELVGLLGGNKPDPSPVPRATDPTIELQILQMKLNHDLQMKKFDIESARAEREFQLKLQEFADNRADKKVENEDKRNLRANGLNALQDIANSVVVGMGADMGEAPPVAKHPIASQAKSPTAANHQPVTEPQMEAVLLSFPCQNCKTEIEVPKGGGNVSCPDCGATYNITQGAE
jgi:hypothetical protein